MNDDKHLGEQSAPQRSQGHVPEAVPQLSHVALLYDVTQKKVGCVLLQAVYGGDSSIAQRIPNEDWFFGPTRGMSLYRMSRAQADQLVAFHNERRAKAVGRRNGRAVATAASDVAQKKES